MSTSIDEMVRMISDATVEEVESLRKILIEKMQLGLGVESITQAIKNATPDQAMEFESVLREAQFSKKVKIYFSDANAELGNLICQDLGLKRAQYVSKWSNNEIRAELKDSVKGCHCFIVSSYHENSNIRHMELIGIINACRSSGAEKVIAVIPFFGYSKQEKIKQGREAIMAAVIAHQICQAGVDRVVLIDLHADAIQGFFNVPVDHLRTLKYFVEEIRRIKKFNPKEFVAVSPDAGGVPRARKFSGILNSLLAVIFKYRPTPESVDSTRFLGKVRDMIACIFDDLIQSAGTLIESVISLIKRGAKKIYIAVVHGDWCGDAVKNMKILMLTGAVDGFFISDTTPCPEEIRKLPNVTIISVHNLLAEAIKRIYMQQPLSDLWEMNGPKGPEKKDDKKRKPDLLKRVASTLRRYRRRRIDIDDIRKKIAA